MPKSNYSDRRDANEPEIVKELERLGFYVIRMARTCGFDLLAINSKGKYIIEVKNPDTYWKLTGKEYEVESNLRTMNIPYWVITSIEDIDDMIKYGKKRTV
jgi:Holliday junction resolvase